MIPPQLAHDMPLLSDTELRIILVALANSGTPLSIGEMQERTGRKRQLYEAIKSLESAGRLVRGKSTRQGETVWVWTVPPYQTSEPAVPTKKSASKKKPVKEKPAKPVTAQHHPAVVAYVEIVRRRPTHAAAERIAQEVDDVERWKSAVNSYVLQGWNPMNVANMLRVYKGEMKIQQGGRRVVSLTIPHQSPDDAKRQWEAYLQEGEQ